MTIYVSGTQQSVVNPEIVFPGDRIGLPETWLPALGYIASNTIAIASGCFGIYGTNTVSQGQVGSAPFAGIVLRNQASVIPYANTTYGNGFAVAAGYMISVGRNGNFAAVIAVSYNVGNAINNGDAVFVNTTDGTFAVGGVNVPAGYIQTDFIIVNNAITNNYGNNLVAISNTNQFLGAVYNVR